MDPFQKLRHSETRKLVLVIGIITSTGIAIQFFLPPYENVLAYLFPADNTFLHAKNSSLAGDFSPKSVMTYNGSPWNRSSTDFSLVDGVVSNTTSSEAFEMGEETKNETAGDDGEKNGYVSPLHTLPPLVSPTNLSILKGMHSGPAMSPIAREPGLLLSVPVMPPNAEKPGLLRSGLAMPPNAENPGLLRSSTIMPPIADEAGLLQGVSVMMPPKAENPGLLQIAAAKPPNTENPQLLHSGPDTSNNKSSMSTKNIKKATVKVPPKVMSLSEMNLLLLQSHASSHSTTPQWSSIPNQEILSAKSQIENAPMIKSDGELYAPLFRNPSMFKKSYELMEQKLKVFIYSEGARPIFHQPILDGIYASEGWFMKQMESNKHFVVKDPEKAHLFYLPFSSQILRYTLYVPDSHSRKNIVKYLKNYMSIITTKYPFWNRTGGADHFLVACHDWAPPETKKAMGGSIRALCNADVNEAGFIIGKDVSLPETNVRSVSNPLKDLGGKPASKRTILAFFAGRAHGYLREILLKHWENKDPDMKISNGTNTRVKSKNYIQYMKNSKYCICPKGYEVNSPRIVEAIFSECVPVIISDNFVPPFFNVLDWEAFAIFVPEKDIPKLKNILDSIPEQKYVELQRRVKKAQQHFLWHTKPVKYDMFHMILHSIWYNRVFQI